MYEVTKKVIRVYTAQNFESLSITNRRPCSLDLNSVASWQTGAKYVIPYKYPYQQGDWYQQDR